MFYEKYIILLPYVQEEKGYVKNERSLIGVIS